MPIEDWYFRENCAAAECWQRAAAFYPRSGEGYALCPEHAAMIRTTTETYRLTLLRLLAQPGGELAVAASHADLLGSRNEGSNA